VTVQNPLSREHSVLRQSLVGSLLGIVGTNLRHGRDAVSIFEIGRGYARGVDGPTEWNRLGFALCGSAVPAHWADPVRGRDLDDGKGLVDLVARLLGAAEATFEPLTDDPRLHPGRSARVRVPAPDGGTAIVGRIGELHPAMLESLDLRTERVIVGELAVAGLAGGALPVARAVAPPRYPAVERDLAVVVPASEPAARVASVIRADGGALLADLRLFDIYRGVPLQEGRKSLAFRLTFQAPDRTLTEGEVDAAVASVTQGLASIDGHIRS